MAEGKTITIIQKGKIVPTEGCKLKISHKSNPSFGDSTILSFDVAGTTYNLNVDEYKLFDLVKLDEIGVSNVKVTGNSSALLDPHVGIYNEFTPWSGTNFICRTDGLNKDIDLWVFENGKRTSIHITAEAFCEPSPTPGLSTLFVYVNFTNDDGGDWRSDQDYSFKVNYGKGLGPGGGDSFYVITVAVKKGEFQGVTKGVNVDNCQTAPTNAWITSTGIPTPSGNIIWVNDTSE